MRVSMISMSCLALVGCGLGVTGLLAGDDDAGGPSHSVTSLDAGKSSPNGDSSSESDDGSSRSDSSGREGDGGDVNDLDGGDASDDGGVDSGTANPNAGPGIYCGQVLSKAHYCEPTVDVCCLTPNIAAPPTYTCEGAGSASCSGLAIPCDSNTECSSGNICCGTYALITSTYTNVACSASCDLKQSQYQLCNPSAVPSECVTSGTTCQPSTALPGFSVCD
jgi:hypothetical protein